MANTPHEEITESLVLVGKEKAEAYKRYLGANKRLVKLELAAICDHDWENISDGVDQCTICQYEWRY